MKLEDRIKEIELHDPFCHMGLDMNDGSKHNCDCSKSKREKAILSAFREYGEEIIGEDLGYSDHQVDREYWDKVNRNIEVMNALRAEQRKRMESLLSGLEETKDISTLDPDSKLTVTYSEEK